MQMTPIASRTQGDFQNHAAHAEEGEENRGDGQKRPFPASESVGEDKSGNRHHVRGDGSKKPEYGNDEFLPEAYVWYGHFAFSCALLSRLMKSMPTMTRQSPSILSGGMASLKKNQLRRETPPVPSPDHMA